MPGIVSIVDGEVRNYVQHAWELLGRERGPVAAAHGSLPHVSHRVPERHYRASTGLFESVDRAVSNCLPLEATTTGFGVDHVALLDDLCGEHQVVRRRAFSARMVQER